MPLLPLHPFRPLVELVTQDVLDFPLCSGNAGFHPHLWDSADWSLPVVLSEGGISPQAPSVPEDRFLGLPPMLRTLECSIGCSPSQQFAVPGQGILALQTNITPFSRWRVEVHRGLLKKERSYGACSRRVSGCRVRALRTFSSCKPHLLPALREGW